MWAIIGFIVGFSIAIFVPSHYKGRPILSVAIVYCRRNSKLKWLAWQIPLFGDDSWYFDIVERDVLNHNRLI